MAVRIISSLVGLPFLVLVVLTGGLALKIALMAVSLIGLYELYRGLFKKHLSIHYFGYLGCILYIYFIDKFNPSVFLAI
ncbi:MAG: phosphatidate cytidylyltransferase, partial [Clostridiales bacterium]|nr:phosphatidate cytidylyltransferase [Clostridiales bacterium]